MERASQVVKCLNILPRLRIHTVLCEQEFRYNLLLCYQECPTDLPEKFDVFISNKPFTLQHMFQFKVG